MAELSGKRMAAEEASLANPLAHRTWRLRVRSRFFLDPASLFGLALVGLVTSAALAAPLLATYDPTLIDLGGRLLRPSGEHLLGTDHLGRDVFSRLLWGGRTTLGAAAVVLAAVAAVSFLVGGLAGYYGGWLDTALMGVVDVLLAFPPLILAVAVAGTLGPGLPNLLLAVGAVWWAGYARLIRGMTLSMRQKDFVEAARAIGAGDARILTLHIFRNIAGPVVVLMTLDFGWIVLGISGLNFLGLGVQPPTPEWGAMLNDARPYLQSHPLLLLYPGAAICLTALGVNLLGDGLRDWLDPGGK